MRNGCAVCGSRTGGSFLAEGTTFCPNHATERAHIALASRGGRRWLQTWQARLADALRTAET